MIEPQDYLEYILKGITSYPDDIKITRSQDSDGIFLEVELNPEDMGQVIGKGGDTITSIRRIMHPFGMKTLNLRVSVKIIEPNKEEKELEIQSEE